MKTCAACGQSKPNADIRCPHCEEMDHEVAQAMVAGTPGLTLLILGLLGFWAWRFWQLGMAAWGGNLRIAALAAAGLGVAGLMFGSMWTFGIRTRKTAAILLVVAVVLYLAAHAI